jgi:hypothetical protein
MTLLYLRHNTNHALVGEMFGVSADTSENAFYQVIEVLKAEFPASKWEAEKKFRQEPKWSLRMLGVEPGDQRKQPRKNNFRQRKTA